jgi:uroporphyrinogen-III decarboxylase
MIRAFCDMRLEHTLESVRAQGKVLKGKNVFIPLHKGMDKFMSDDQFRRLYWADLRTIIEEIVRNDMTPYVYTEGPYDSRLEALTEVPKGKVIYHFETVDMANAKKILGDTACIAGGFPILSLWLDTKEKLVDECKRLIDVCAPGGGFIFETGSGFDDAKEENVEALFETVKEYGRY